VAWASYARLRAGVPARPAECLRHEGVDLPRPQPVAPLKPAPQWLCIGFDRYSWVAALPALVGGGDAFQTLRESRMSVKVR